MPYVFLKGGREGAQAVWEKATVTSSHQETDESQDKACERGVSGIGKSKVRGSS